VLRRRSLEGRSIDGPARFLTSCEKPARGTLEVRTASCLQHILQVSDMAQRASDLIGKSVVSADTGERLGTVSDILLDETDHRLVGLVVQRGMMKSEHVLPSASVQTYGRDAVVSRNAQDLITAKEWQRSKS
jgi:sporulation protein YlmC with PRC-barrel domain